MHGTAMAEDLLHAFPSFQTAINSFMASPRFAHRFLVLFIVKFVRVAHFSVAFVPTIGNHFLTLPEHTLKSASKYLDVWPPSTLKRTIVSNNVTRLYCNSQFIAKARPIEFVGVPTRRPRSRLRNHKVYAVDRDEAALSRIPVAPVLPQNL